MASMYRLTDNSRNGVPADPGLAASTLYARLHGRTLRELDRNEFLFTFPPSASGAASVDDDEMVLWGSPDSLKTGNLMGFFGCDGNELVIGSRFTSSENSDWFLHRMLGKAMGFSAVDMKLGMDTENQRYALLELLFPGYFKQALSKGPFRTYVKRTFDDAHVRGVIDVPRFIRDDQPFAGKIAYNTREYSENNSVMHLIRHTIEAMLRGGAASHSHVARLFAEDHELYMLSETVRRATPNFNVRDRAKVIAANVKSPLRSRYHRAYRDLQRLCIAILTGREVSPVGEKGKVHGMLFDGSWLWEEYLNCLFEDAGLEVFHPGNREGRGRQYLFRSNTALAGEIYPDFIAEGASGLVVMDAKYKRINGIYGADYQQILAYMFRFESTRGFFLYPEEDLKEEKKYLLLSGVRPNESLRKGAEATVVKLGLPIPRHCEGEDEFSEEMGRGERWLVRVIEEALSA